MHDTRIEATVWPWPDNEAFDVTCRQWRCKFSSLGHITYEAAVRVAEAHEYVTSVPWYRRWHGRP